MRTFLCLLGAGTVASWSAGLVPHQPPSRAAVSHNRATAQMIDMEVVIGVGVTLLGVGGGVGLIAFTENAGKRNEEVANNQVCVDCTGEKVIVCSLCKGTGTDPFADLVRGVQEMAGDDVPPPPPGGDKVVVDDWDVGEKEVVMFEDILADFPVRRLRKSARSAPAREWSSATAAKALASRSVSSSGSLRTTSWIEAASVGMLRERST